MILGFYFLLFLVSRKGIWEEYIENLKKSRYIKKMESSRLQTITFEDKSLKKTEDVEEDKVTLEMNRDTWKFLFARIESDLKRRAYRRKYNEKKGIITKKGRVVNPEEIDIGISVIDEPDLTEENPC